MPGIQTLSEEGSSAVAWSHSDCTCVCLLPSDPSTHPVERKIITLGVEAYLSLNATALIMAEGVQGVRCAFFTFL